MRFFRTQKKLKHVLVIPCLLSIYYMGRTAHSLELKMSGPLPCGLRPPPQVSAAPQPPGGFCSSQALPLTCLWHIFSEAGKKKVFLIQPHVQKPFVNGSDNNRQEKQKNKSEHSDGSCCILPSCASHCAGLTCFGTQAHVKFTRTQNSHCFHPLSHSQTHSLMSSKSNGNAD